MPNSHRVERDRLASLLEWKQQFIGDRGAWYRNGKMFTGGDHPISDSLDAADACFPEGWDWRRCMWDGNHVWMGASAGMLKIDAITVPESGDKISDLMRLAALCIKQDKS